MRIYTFESFQDWAFTAIFVQISESRAAPSGVGIAPHL